MKALFSSSLLLFVLAILLALCCAEMSGQASCKTFLECLTYQSDHLNPISQVLFIPENSSYTSILQLGLRNLRFTSPEFLKPLVIVTPVHESQIQSVIYCARKHGVHIRIRCGGHDFEGLSYTASVPFVMIDMINLQSVDVDLENNSAWVQGGANIGEVYYRIAEKSSKLGFPGAVRGTVGVTGLISGGGYGAMVRKYGLAADNVIDVRMINVNGEILDRKSMGEDLFWAIRGGIASSFGVIVAWKLKLVAVPETVTIFSVARTLEQGATDLVHKWQYVAPKIDRDLYIRIQIRAVNLNQDGSKRTIVVSFESLFLGGVDKLLSIMQISFPELDLVKDDCREVSWLKSSLWFAGNSAFRFGESVELLLNRSLIPYLYYKAKSDYVQEPISKEGLQMIWKKYFELEAGAANILMTPYGGKMDEFSASELPFPHRAGNLYMMYNGVSWQANTSKYEQLKRLNWLKSLYSDLAPFVSKNPRTAYINYNDLDLGIGSLTYEEASQWGFKYFGINFERLVRVKTLVDPDNFFNHQQSIPAFPSSSKDEL
ncbi:cannabidiolic acid synthase-like 2 [Heracleum sosnowskyi]|uniref:Cannabidiolic acid synthase-like 2 n=1 Tax=Heracleum sosnowskyi TaxID=360622 RepID=A0AAD8N0T2_9APIA|nr:cannabidiolic acid synthase-like 2 [Heracleum sosnowskyi]